MSEAHSYGSDVLKPIRILLQRSRIVTTVVMRCSGRVSRGFSGKKESVMLLDRWRWICCEGLECFFLDYSTNLLTMRISFVNSNRRYFYARNVVLLSLSKANIRILDLKKM